jgi:hypothetical protein
MTRLGVWAWCLVDICIDQTKLGAWHEHNFFTYNYDLL